MMQGIFCVWKPKGPTSHDIINKLRKLTGEKKVGHAGTLDPLAEGVLVVGVGRENTRKLFKGENPPAGGEKEYVAEIKLGEESTTDDEEGIKKQIEIKETPEIEEIEKVLKLFIGNIRQAPPKYSAAKAGGKKAYEEARAGRNMELGFHDVEIKLIEILNYKWPVLEVKVVTGSGVYIRALARDIGEKLKTGAYLTGLIRSRVGEYEKKDCRNIE